MQPKKIIKQQMQERVEHTFQDALNLLIPSDVKHILEESNIIDMKEVSQHIHYKLNKSTKNAAVYEAINIDEDSLESDSDSEKEAIQDDTQNEDSYDDGDDKEGNNINFLPSAKCNYLQTMKGVCDIISPDLKDSFF